MSEDSDMNVSRLSVPDELKPVVALAITRAQYLFPEIELSFDGENIEIRTGPSVDPENIIRQVRYTLYREHCAKRDASFRSVMTQALFT